MKNIFGNISNERNIWNYSYFTERTIMHMLQCPKLSSGKLIIDMKVKWWEEMRKKALLQAIFLFSEWVFRDQSNWLKVHLQVHGELKLSMKFFWLFWGRIVYEQWHIIKLLNSYNNDHLVYSYTLSKLENWFYL